MIKITNKVDCCGCNACGDACAKGAISFKTDIEGFWYPEVNQKLCADCGLCEKACPIINVKELKKNDLPQSECYAAEHKNMEVVFDSTSGGLFSALADIVYRDGGYVGGAIFNDDFSVRQYISSDKSDLPRLRSSKYLQSNLEGFFKQVKELVKTGEKVLVCGCPCQMTALRAFLRKDYDNLIIVDFICRGINSPKVWRKYLDSFEERYGSPVVYSKAKSKEYGWRNLTQKVILANGKHVYEPRSINKFAKGYLHTGVFCRPSCYDCKFKGYPRIADITLADFWGIENVDTSMEKDLGISLVMINSQKGQAFFERVKSRINWKSVPFNSIEAGNRSLNLSVESPKVDRKQFFEDLDRMTFTEVADKYFYSDKQSDAPMRLPLRTRIRYKLSGYKNRLMHVAKHPRQTYFIYKLNTAENRRKGHIIFPHSHCVINIGKKACVNLQARFEIGIKQWFPQSHLESRLLVADGGELTVMNKQVVFSYGADIEVFSGGQLIFHGGVGANIGCTIICGERIEIGRDVMMGRNVTIRDNNGGHYINRPGYRNTRPVVIGDKAWLCEGCTIMQGVKIGDGAIVGAHAFVTSNVPAHCMVSGNPAVIVDRNVLWKY